MQKTIVSVYLCSLLQIFCLFILNIKFAFYKIKNKFKRQVDMNNLISKVFFCFIIFFTGLSVHGQQTQPLTLSQAIKIGLENSKNLKLSKAKVDIANARYKEAVDATIPSVGLTGNYTRNNNITPFVFALPPSNVPTVLYPNIPNTYIGKASLSEVIFSGFRLKYAEASQKLLQQSVSLSAQKDSDELVFNIVSAYYNLYKIKKSQEIVSENLEEVKEHESETQNMENQGLVTHNEILRWELQQENVELTQLDLENNLNVATFDLDIMLGLKENTKIEIDSASLFSSKEFKSLQDYMDMAANNRGDLLSLDAIRKSSENNLKIVQNSYYPIVTIGADYYDARPNQRIFPPTDAFNIGWDAGITLTWNLTNLYSNKHNIAEAKGNLDQAEVQKSILSDNIKMEINQNYLSYIESKKRLEVMQKAIDTADENYRITNDKYKNQLALLSDLLDADNALLQAKINLALAKADAELAYYKLLESTGTIN
jgi:outer membrane protein